MAMSPRLLRPRASGYDPAAQVYFNAVAVADGEQLEPAVKKAINDFVVGCKRDGIWSSIKASCLLIGARTLSGALTPLVGAAPTNNGPFVSGDYNRKTGLTGNGTSKYLDSGRSSTADSQDDVHISVYQSAAASSTANVFMTHIGSVDGSSVATQIAEGFPSSVNVKIRRARSTGALSGVSKDSTNNANGLQGVSRSVSGSFVYRAGATDTTVTNTSSAQSGANYFVLAQNNNGTVANYSNATLAFYSIGSSLTLSLLGPRLATLYTAIGAAIP